MPHGKPCKIPDEGVIRKNWTEGDRGRTADGVLVVGVVVVSDACACAARSVAEARAADGTCDQQGRGYSVLGGV